MDILKQTVLRRRCEETACPIKSTDGANRKHFSHSKVPGKYIIIKKRKFGNNESVLQCYHLLCNKHQNSIISFYFILFYYYRVPLLSRVRLSLCLCIYIYIIGISKTNTKWDFLSAGTSKLLLLDNSFLSILHALDRSKTKPLVPFMNNLPSPTPPTAMSRRLILSIAFRRLFLIHS